MVRSLNVLGIYVVVYGETSSSKMRVTLGRMSEVSLVENGWKSFEQHILDATSRLISAPVSLLLL